MEEIKESVICISGSCRQLNFPSTYDSNDGEVNIRGFGDLF